MDVADLWIAGGRLYLCGSPGMVEGVKSMAKRMIQDNLKTTSPDQIERFFESMRNERIAVDVFA
jgi:cytochrome P450 / NADPH-cytochrome P450 reductase